MAKIAKNQPLDDRELTPEGTYRLLLVKCLDKVKPVTYGGKTENKPRFIWVFECREKRTRQGTKFVWEVCERDPERKELPTVVKVTGQEYGYVEAALTPFLDDMLPGEAGRFMDAVGDTEELIGWDGEATVKHEQNEGKTYANLIGIKPREEWFIKFCDTKLMPPENPFGEDTTH